MDDILIRPFESRDRQAIRDICCDDADQGKPVEGLFPDREVAADILTGYYTDYDLGSTFVAHRDGAVVGYVNGCFDNRRYGLTLFWIIVPCALLKAVVRKTVFKKEFWTMINGMARNGQRLLVWRKESFHSHEGHMHIGVAKAGRGYGVGARLVQALLAAARARGVDRITASVHDANLPARGFFEHLGFVVVKSYPMVMVREGRTEHYRSLCYVKYLS